MISLLPSPRLLLSILVAAGIAGIFVYALETNAAVAAVAGMVSSMAINIILAILRSRGKRSHTAN